MPPVALEGAGFRGGTGGRGEGPVLPSQRVCFQPWKSSCLPQEDHAQGALSLQEEPCVGLGRELPSAQRSLWETESGPRAAPRGSIPRARRSARGHISLILFNPHRGPITEGCVAARLPSFFPSSLPLPLLPQREDTPIHFSFLHPLLNLAFHKPRRNSSDGTLSKTKIPTTKP